MITSLRLKGFRRYVDERLSFEGGITFIDGENNAGKTTVFLAIEYALFGTAGGIRSPIALLQPGQSGLGVEMEFTGKDGKRYRLQRVHSKPPKARTKLVGHFTLKALDADGANGAERYLLSSDFQDHEDALALKLQEITGISRRVFELAVHVRQGEVASILDGDVKLDIALGITAASSANEEFRALALEDEQATASLPTLEASLAHVEKERALLATDDAKAKTSIAALEAKVAAAEKILLSLPEVDEDGEHDSDDDDEDEDDDEHDDDDAAAGLPARARARVKASKDGGEDEEEAEELEIDPKLIREHAELQGRVNRREKLLKSGVKSAVCEHCGQTIDTTKANSELAEWNKELSALEKKLENEHARVEKEEERREKEREKKERAREAARKKAEAERMEIERKRAKAEAERDAASEQLEEQRDALAQKVERLSETEREVARLQVEVASLATRASRAAKLRTLAAAFKEMQEQLRTKAAQELALAVQRIHKALSDVDEIAHVEIDPVRYQVLVTPHDVGVAMPASVAQGGGHKLLLGLAFRLALIERLGPFPFALLDEPTYGLDAKRRTALLGRVAGLGMVPQILLITHQDMGDVKGQRLVIERGVKTSALKKAS